ncbi:L-aspartate oxidase [soil metagenome]
MKVADFVVVGSGIAGLSFALKAAKHGRVLVLTKRARGDSNTAWAQGGVACVSGDDDSFDIHLADTLDAGAGLCDEEAVRTIVSEGPPRIEELRQLGVEFDGHDENGARIPDLTREGGHTRRRILHFEDTTGKEISRKLIAAVENETNIEVLENHFVIDLITTAKLGAATEDRVVGLYVLDEESGEVLAVRADRIVLATGGCGRVYQHTTNPPVATGDGVAIAWRAGVTISNMEFIQFHPTCLFHPARKSFLISEAVRGEGGVLIGEDGKPFMENYDERRSLAPRDIVARAIDTEIKRTGSRCVFLDVTHLEAGFMARRFPNIYQTCLEVGIDAEKVPIPVVPAAHYQCGGVRTTVNGETSLRGLYAVGEVGCTGLHGANRLASNSLLEAAVVAHRACEHMMRKLPITARVEQPRIQLEPWRAGDVQDVDELIVIYHNWDEIRRLMWDYVSIVRTDKRLIRAGTRLANLKREVQEFYWNFKITSDLLELRNLVEVAGLIVDCASRRKESRGLHYTRDYPAVGKGVPQDTIIRRF